MNKLDCKLTWNPYFMLTCPDAMLINILGMKYGLSRRKRCVHEVKNIILSTNITSAVMIPNRQETILCTKSKRET